MYDIRGAIDLHVHAGPSLAKRSVDSIEMYYEAAEAGFAGFLIKEHYLPSVFEATLINEHIRTEGGPVAYGGLCVNNATGGLNLMAVDAACSAGAKFICLPTVSAVNHLEHHPGKFPGSGNMITEETGIYYLDDSGELLPEMQAILDYVREHSDAFIMTGHATVAEIDAVIRYCRDHGFNKVLVNHPHYEIGATIEDMVRWAGCGAYIELNAVVFDGIGKSSRRPLSLAKEMLDNVPLDMMVLDTDLGQKSNMTPVTGLIKFCGILIDELGLSSDDIDLILKTNPRKLVE